MLISAVPLLRDYIDFIRDSKNTLSILNYTVTWILLIISGLFFTIGSWAFARSFDDTEPESLFKYYHVQTDELLAAWLFFLGILPAAPYSIIFLVTDTTKLTYWGMVVLSFLFIGCSYLFVRTCYPSDTMDSEKVFPVYFYIYLTI